WVVHRPRLQARRPRAPWARTHLERAGTTAHNRRVRRRVPREPCPAQGAPPRVSGHEGARVEERLRVDLLGQFRVRHGAAELPELDTPRLRALLGRLAL